MLIIMGGMPKSGKTVFVDQLAPLLGASVYSPGKAIPNEKLSEEQRRDLYIASWQNSVDDVTAFIHRKKRGIGIFDTTGSNLRTLTGFETFCAVHDVPIRYVYVHAKKEDCLARGIASELFDSYLPKIKECILHFKDKMLIVRNDGTMQDLALKAGQIADALKG